MRTVVLLGFAVWALAWAPLVGAPHQPDRNPSATARVASTGLSRPRFRARARARVAICGIFRSRCRAALKVARCESRLVARALGAAGERGLFQIHPVHFGWLNAARLFEPRYNARVAFLLSAGGRDWHHWTCRP